MNAGPQATDPQMQSADDVHSQTPLDEGDHRTRTRVLDLVLTDGPITAAALAKTLNITATAVRRHLTSLIEHALIEPFAAPTGKRGRGRPARRFVGTERAQTIAPGAYSELAKDVLNYLEEVAGEDAVNEYAKRRIAELQAHLAPSVDADTVQGRTEQLAEALAAEGYLATTRPGPGGMAIQLCQGYCPVQQVAAEFPQLCDAEAKAFSDLLGVHVQRLSTMPNGGHVCTTHIPTAFPNSRNTHVEGTQ